MCARDLQGAGGRRVVLGCWGMSEGGRFRERLPPIGLYFRCLSFAYASKLKELLFFVLSVVRHHVLLLLLLLYATDAISSTHGGGASRSEV